MVQEYDIEKWLIKYLKEHNHVPETTVRNEMSKIFNIKLDTAYRKIKEIMKGNDHLRKVWNKKTGDEYVLEYDE